MARTSDQRRRKAPARAAILWATAVLALFGLAALMTVTAPEVSAPEPGFPRAPSAPADWRGDVPAQAPLLR